MGGKIRAYNKITRYAEELALQQHDSGTQEVILNTDQAYWTVVSLVHKQRLAESYLALLQQLENDVDKMIAEGVATKADGLSVKVKVNEAEMTLTKVADGLSLARMLLCQLCGLPLDSNPRLDDEETDDLPATATPPTRDIDMEAVYASRPEVRSLEIAARIYDQKVRVTRSDMLPSIALMGNYIATSPSVFNSFEKKFKGMWNVGVMVSLPLWHWGEGINKVKAAKSDARIARYQLDSEIAASASQPVGFPDERSRQETGHGREEPRKSRREPALCQPGLQRGSHPRQTTYWRRTRPGSRHSRRKSTPKST